ncbi:UPF0182 family protein [Aminivibrio sp.]|uniref:UPF0182 family membrane protein n=1 Tax=Aminivibrio sp. TaxID=1872489 RepID=UPI001A5A2044|nr:UPF0182 family protein [Aminivibrio sp.]MBL3539148.1 UPF0182 family protein [Aminivibrio sp.]
MTKKDWFPNNEWFPGEDSSPKRPFPSFPFRINKGILLAGGAAVVLFVLLPVLADFYTDYLWYDTEGYGSVFWTRLLARLPLFGAGFLLYAAFLWLNLSAARKNLRALYPEQEGLLGAKAAGVAVAAAALFLGFTNGAAMTGEWTMVLRYFHGTPFGVTDPIFGHDIGFYVFGLPFWRFLHAKALNIVFLCLVTAGGAYAAFLLPRNRDLASLSVPAKMRNHLVLLASAGAFLWSAGYLLDRYDLLFSPTGVVFGAGYTDVNAELLALNVLAVLSLLLGLSLLVSLLRKTWKFSLGLAGLVLVTAVLLQGVYPAVVQKYFVGPNEFEREKRFIEYNIDATLKAYGLSNIALRTVTPDDSITWENVEQNRDTIDNIRLWDHAPLLRSYKQLQEIRTYYDFSNVDIDRYTFDGEYRQVMLSPRELDLKGLQNPTWINTRLEFTHGYGIVMNPVNEVAGSGLPRLWVRDIPPKTDVPLSITRPEIYYGEKPSSYIFVGTTVKEFDYPMGESNVRTTYEGKGGVPMGTLFRRILYAIKFADFKILFSDVFTENSRVKYHQNIRERLTRVAPFLYFDRDPYLVVSEGRLVWMQDAYTAADRYPYSQPVSLGRGGTINYIRNSVKATVDAYDGTMKFFVSDPDDPVLKAWSGVFPGLFRPMSEMSSGLKAHLRYPQDLFSIQSEIYRIYHMTDANTFYNKEDSWDRNSSTDRKGIIEAYYVNMRLVGEERSEFVLITPFMPVNRDNMIAWMAGRSDGDNYGELLVYQFPKQKLIYGPSQVEALTNQNSEISAQLSLWGQRGSSVIRGNMTVVPVGNGILYIQPLYLRAENSELPELRRVITSTGGKVVWGETLDDSLVRLLGPSDGRPALPLPSAGETPLRPVRPEGESPALSVLAGEASDAWDAARKALREDDWEKYGREMKKLESVLKEMQEISAQNSQN